jgi:hypothetical protein
MASPQRTKSAVRCPFVDPITGGACVLVIPEDGRELPPGAIHVDVCPGCETPSSYHALDSPAHCQCGIDREEWQPMIYVPLEVERLKVIGGDST